MDRRERLIRSGLTLASELSLEVVLQRIVELAAEITEARYGALGVLGADGRISGFITTGISEEARRAIGDPPTGHGLLGLLIREAQPLRVDRIDRHGSSYGFPPHHPPMTSFLGAPIASRGQVFGNIYLTDKRGGEPFDQDDEEALVILASQAAIAIENARLYEEARTRQRWLEAVRQIATAILTGAQHNEALHLVARHARELTGADLSLVAVPHGGASLRVAFADGARAADVLGQVYPIEASMAGEVVRTGEPIVCRNASKDARAYQPIVRAGHMGPLMIVPLSSQGRAFGTLTASNEAGGRLFTDEEVRLLQAFADQAAVALQYARAQQEVERLAVLEDRERIARELHDGVIQALFAVGMGLQGTALGSTDEQMTARIEGAVAELDRVIRDLRNYIFGLRPGILADRQLDKALRALVEEFQSKTGVVTIVDIDEEIASVLSTMAGDIVQLTREALSNVGRHAEAATCRVSLRHRDGTAVLEVDDDGRGFDPTTSHRGDGLSNLEVRVEALGGTTSITSAPAEGTTVRIEIPV
ncbi:MAG TPA: GAF domain-containing sensor histidine kinase [Actinomycetota bacterium]|nr:GAF domain-containing sensor histidine kinase [Actinomycetota bacterium]